MKRLFFSLLLLSGCGGQKVDPNTSTETATEAESTVLPTAESILDKALEVTNAKAEYENLNYVTLTTKMAVPQAGIVGTMVSHWKTPNIFVIEQDIPGIGKGKMGYNGEIGWSNDNMMGPRLLEGKELQELIMDADLTADLDYKKWYTSLEVVELTEFNGKSAYKLNSTTTFGKESTRYFDAETGYDLGMEAEVESPMGPMTIRMHYSEWTNIGGVTAPKFTKVQTGPVSMESEILTIETNPELDDSVFDPPAVILELWNEQKAASETGGSDEAPAESEPKAE